MKHLHVYALLFVLIAIIGCERDIELDVPATEPAIVVEGNIETDQPPIVVLSRTNGFFEPVSAESIANSYITNADVRVNGTPLDLICTADLSDELREVVSQAIGVPTEVWISLWKCEGPRHVKQCLPRFYQTFGISI
ncbi:MAG: DUF4249 domain-containing protein [Flavobacteriales bacterium]|nr:DUF4249 domain-containing protein [Flavobacteriales bacterium]